MTPEEAIEVLAQYLRDGTMPSPTTFEKALGLGIEALKFYLDSSHYATGCLLPGETRETEEQKGG